MEFEFDPAKSDSNSGKHGLDFLQAQRLWLDPDALEIPARSGSEERRLLIAMLGNKLWSAVFTERQGRIRIISVRRARASESFLYEHPTDDSGKS